MTGTFEEPVLNRKILTGPIWCGTTVLLIDVTTPNAGEHPSDVRILKVVKSVGTLIFNILT